MLALTCALAIFSVPDHLRDGQSLFALLWLAILPLAISIPLVFVASIVVGLPLTALLKWKQRESASIYIAVGSVVGFIIPIAILIGIEASSGYWIALLGAVGGSFTGKTWWASGRKPLVSYSD